MKHRSDIFHPGQRLEGTMLTIVDSVRPDSWNRIICRCDCGNEFISNYIPVYQGKYSCGCRRRLRVDAVNLEGFTAYDENSNRGDGRTLTIMGRDYATQQWQYLCSCCAGLFLLPRGNERGAQHALKEMARQQCPGFRRYYTVRYEFWKLQDAIRRDTGYKQPRHPAGYRGQIAQMEEYYEKKHLKYDSETGCIEGFYGLPDKPLPPEWKIDPKRMEEKRQAAIAAQIAAMEQDDALFRDL